MTQENKEKQVGALVLRLKKAEQELAQHRERFMRYHEMIRDVDGILASGEFRITYPNGTNPVLVGPADDPAKLPTMDELLEAVRGVRDKGEELSELKERLAALGL